MKEGRVINEAYVRTPGDPSVGIWPDDVTIETIHFDLGCLDEDDRAGAVEEFRTKLADAFEVAWGERPTVTFDYEIYNGENDGR